MAQYAKGDWGWLSEPMRSSHDYLSQCSAVMRATLHGFGMIERAQGLFDALDNFDKNHGEWDETRDQRAIRDAHYKYLINFIQKEKSTDYFTITSQATLALWVGLEAAVTDTVIAVMKNKPRILMEEPFNQVKLSYGAYVNLDEQQIRYLVLGQVENRQEIKNAQGVDRLERLLGLVRLSGTVSKKTKRDILELHAIRNVIVHRRGTADPTFRRVCSWRRDKVGEPVRLTQRHFRRYEAATARYLAAVTHRLARACGLKRARRKTKQPREASSAES